MKKYIAILSLLLLAACGSAPAEENTQPNPSEQSHQDPGSPAGQAYSFEEIGGFVSGMLIDFEPLASGNWLVATREGYIVLLDPDFYVLNRQLIPGETYNDSALGGIAIGPDGKLYVYHTPPEYGDVCGGTYCNALLRFSVDESGDVLLTDEEVLNTYPMINRTAVHNGGALAFGPDGNLYLGIGDGQIRDDADYTAVSQDPTSALGKMHRINPDTLEEDIVAMGLRNPFTMVVTPDGAVIGDVGLDTYEEANFLPWNTDENFGWPIVEGPSDQFTSPISAFKHCDETFQDADPFRAEDEVEAKALTVKNHNGIAHTCKNEIITVLGYIDGTVYYSEPYYGWIRAFDLVDGEATNDRHIAHNAGMTTIKKAPDGTLYGISIFSMGHVLRITTTAE